MPSDDDDGLLLNITDNTFDNFDLNNNTPRYGLLIPTPPPLSPGTYRFGGGFGHGFVNNITREEDV